jgi:hypothetical protein
VAYSNVSKNCGTFFGSIGINIILFHDYVDDSSNPEHLSLNKVAHTESNWYLELFSIMRRHYDNSLVPSGF